MCENRGGCSDAGGSGGGGGDDDGAGGGKTNGFWIGQVACVDGQEKEKGDEGKDEDDAEGEGEAAGGEKEKAGWHEATGAWEKYSERMCEPLNSVANPHRLAVSSEPPRAVCSAASPPLSEARSSASR